MAISFDDALDILSKWEEERLDVRVWLRSGIATIIVHGKIAREEGGSVMVGSASGIISLDIFAFEEIEYHDPREAPRGLLVGKIADSALVFTGNGSIVIAYALL